MIFPDTTHYDESPAKKIANIEVPLDAGDFALMDRRVVDVINRMPEHNRFKGIDPQPLADYSSTTTFADSARGGLFQALRQCQRPAQNPAP